MTSFNLRFLSLLCPALVACFLLASCGNEAGPGPGVLQLHSIHPDSGAAGSNVTLCASSALDSVIYFDEVVTPTISMSSTTSIAGLSSVCEQGQDEIIVEVPATLSEGEVQVEIRQGDQASGTLAFFVETEEASPNPTPNNGGPAATNNGPPEVEVPDETTEYECVSAANGGCPAGQIYDNSTGCCRNRRCDRTVANGEPELAAGGEDQVCNPSTGLWEFPGGCVVPEGVEGPAVSFELREDETHPALDFWPEGRDPETGDSLRPNTVHKGGMRLRGYRLKAAQICGTFSVTSETLENGEEVIAPLLENPDQPGRDLTSEIAENHDFVRCDEEGSCPEVVSNEFDTTEEEVYCLTLHPTEEDPTLAESFPFLMNLTQEQHRFLPLVSCKEGSDLVVVDEEVSSQMSASAYEVGPSVARVTECGVRPYTQAPYVQVQVGAENATSCRVSVRYGNGEVLTPIAKIGADSGYDPDGFVRVDASGRIGGGDKVKGGVGKKFVEDGIRYVPIRDDLIDITCSCSGVASGDSEGKRVTFSFEEGEGMLAATAKEGSAPLCAQAVYYEDQGQALYTTGENGVREYLNDRCDITLDWHFYNRMQVVQALHHKKVGQGKGKPSKKGFDPVVHYNIPWAGKIELVAFRFWGEVGETEPVGGGSWAWDEIRDRVNQLPENEEILQELSGSFGALLPDDRFGKPVFQGIPTGRINAESYLLDNGILKRAPASSLTGFPSTPFESAPSPGRAKGQGSDYQIGWTIDRTRKSYDNPTSNRYALMITQFGETTPSLIKVVDVRHKSIFRVASDTEIFDMTRTRLEMNRGADYENEYDDAFPVDLNESAEIMVGIEAQHLKQNPEVQLLVWDQPRSRECGATCEAVTLGRWREEAEPEYTLENFESSSNEFQSYHFPSDQRDPFSSYPSIQVTTSFRAIKMKITAQGVDGKRYEYLRKMTARYGGYHFALFPAFLCNLVGGEDQGECLEGYACIQRTDSYTPFQEPNGLCVPVIPEGWEPEAS